jgi:hypothetical protein
MSECMKSSTSSEHENLTTDGTLDRPMVPHRSDR